MIKLIIALVMLAAFIISPTTTGAIMGIVTYLLLWWMGTK